MVCHRPFHYEIKFQNMNFILSIICYHNMEPGGGEGAISQQDGAPFGRMGPPLHRGERAP